MQRKCTFLRTFHPNSVKKKKYILYEILYNRLCMDQFFLQVKSTLDAIIRDYPVHERDDKNLRVYLSFKETQAYFR